MVRCSVRIVLEHVKRGLYNINMVLKLMFFINLTCLKPVVAQWNKRVTVNGCGCGFDFG